MTLMDNKQFALLPHFAQPHLDHRNGKEYSPEYVEFLFHHVNNSIDTAVNVDDLIRRAVL